MASNVTEETFSLLLVGRTGTGKSSTGNSIIRQKTFISSSSTTSITKECQVQYARVLNHEVMVVDSPGLADTDMSDHRSLQRFCSEIGTVVANNPDGFDAILIVTEMGRQTEQDQRIIRQLNGVFGENFTQKYAMLVITHADNFDPDENPGQSLETWCDSQSGFFQKLQQECGNRTVLFDNKSRDPDVQEKQLKSLFTLVSQMKQGSARYIPEIFVKAKAVRDRTLLEAQEPILRQEAERGISLIIQDLRNLNHQDPRYIIKLRGLKTKSQKLLEDITTTDNGTGALREIVLMVKNLETNIDDMVSSAQDALVLSRRQRIFQKRQEQLEQLERDLDRQLREERRRRVVAIIGSVVEIAWAILSFIISLR